MGPISGQSIHDTESITDYRNRKINTMITVIFRQAAARDRRSLDAHCLRQGTVIGGGYGRISIGFTDLLIVYCSL